MIHENFECELFLIRHGESASNAAPGAVFGGGSEPPLTPRGLEQARLLGRRLKSEGARFDRTYSSSLLRAVQTAEAIFEEMGQSDRPFMKVDDLVELKSPVWRGVLPQEVHTPDALAYMHAKGSHFVPPAGESHRMVQRRVVGWLEDEIIYNRELVGKEQSLRVAIIGHHISTNCLMQYIMGFDERLIGRIVLDNCSISRFLFSSEGWSTLSINDSSHINGR